MARTRAQRRRHNLFLSVALVATLVVLLFAHDISRSAHESTSLRRSENRTFAQLAQTLLSQEGAVDARLADLLTNATSLSRPVFTARLRQIALQLPLWSTEADLMRRPVLAHEVNTVLAQLTEQRVDDYQRVLDAVAQSLSLPWTPLNTNGLTYPAAQTSLLSTDQQWDRARWSLAGEPGRVVLMATSTSSAVMNLSTRLVALDGSATLSLTRGIGIAAVSVVPAPFPAPLGEILLPPVGLVQLGVSVSNGAFVDQPVTLTVLFTPSNALRPVQRQRMTTTLGPMRSYAFAPRLLTTSAGEKATLTISVTGAPQAIGMTRIRTYLVTMSPSGNA